MSSMICFLKFQVRSQNVRLLGCAGKRGHHMCASREKKNDSIYFLGSVWAKFHHADGEVGPMSFFIKLNMSCKPFKLHLQRESHIIRSFIISSSSFTQNFTRCETWFTFLHRKPNDTYAGATWLIEIKLKSLWLSVIITMAAIYLNKYMYSILSAALCSFKRKQLMILRFSVSKWQ